MNSTFGKRVLTVLTYGVATITMHAQGTFQNLDFESAVILPVPGDPYGRVQFAPAFPGWTGSLGTNQQDLALFNNLFIGTAAIALLGPGWSGTDIIAGNYTAVLQAGSDPSGSITPVDASIAQSGMVPAGARTIQLVSSGARNGFIVSLNGQRINMAIVGTQNGFNTYAGDISQFAGLAEELKITALSAPSSPANLDLDSIVFSAQAIPEPSALGLFVPGLVALTLGRRGRLHERRENRSANLHQPNSHALSGMARHEAHQASSGCPPCFQRLCSSLSISRSSLLPRKSS